LLGLLEEKKETIKVENFLVYFPHFILVHDSFLDEKLFEEYSEESTSICRHSELPFCR